MAAEKRKRRDSLRNGDEPTGDAVQELDLKGRQDRIEGRGRGATLLETLMRHDELSRRTKLK
eukprot:8570740-Prorocentrum_lima.AAC.1